MSETQTKSNKSGTSSARRDLILRLCACAMALALAFVTSFLKIHFLWGGSITFFSMFFIVYIGYCYGFTTGIITAFAYALLQIIQGSYYLTPFQFCCDYLFAFTSLGVSGLFRKNRHGLLIGYFVAVLLRGFWHSLGGYLYWMEYMPEDFPKQLEIVYPILYNYSYLLAEAAATTVILLLPPTKKALSYVRVSILHCVK